MRRFSITKPRTFYRLGVLNLLWVLAYRLTMRAGVFAKTLQIEPPVSGCFFAPVAISPDASLNSLELRAFGWIDFPKDLVPQWQSSIFSNQTISDAEQKHWSQLSDFDLSVGDIKGVWELSRFDWVLHFALKCRKSGCDEHIDTLNRWLTDWSASNPANQGINWKCGQEAAIRVIHLCLAAYLLKQHERLSESLTLMLAQHLKRISPTVLYAMAQDNNHGTSEAVALFIGGLLLEHSGYGRHASKWKKQGRFWIGNRVGKLISSDGSFSQHSVNYHRLMLDALSMAEFFRVLFDQEAFSKSVQQRLSAAAVWLATFIEPSTGDVPNIGANDGARIIPLTDTDYRDFRPTARLAMALFLNKSVFAEHQESAQLFTLLNHEVPEEPYVLPAFHLFDKGGYAFASRGQARLFLKYPRYQFRPGQCDALHLDVWLGGWNILRDAGSYSYNTEPFWMNYFPGTAAHNTVQFDDQEQMPRISRFLYGDWLKASRCQELVYSGRLVGFCVGYNNTRGHSHHRSVKLTDQRLIVQDQIAGFNERAVMRWRLIPGQYSIQGNSILGEFFQLSVSASSEIKRFEIVPGWESPYYFRMNEMPVLEIELSRASTITTEITWDLAA